MILIIDNYDSFTYNLYQMIGEIYPEIKTVRNDEITIDEIKKLSPKAIVLSPGPGKPSEAGICVDIVREFGGVFPIMGVCLGHQAICECYGGTVTYASKLMHGKQSDAELDTRSELFKGLPKEIKVARYHSLAADPATIPECLKVIATTADGEVMAVQHKEYPIFGLQFHPESILTPVGKTIIRNFIKGDLNHD